MTNQPDVNVEVFDDCVADDLCSNFNAGIDTAVDDSYYAELFDLIVQPLPPRTPPAAQRLVKQAARVQQMYERRYSVKASQGDTS
jgi:hypothetical protein